MNKERNEDAALRTIEKSLERKIKENEFTSINHLPPRNIKELHFLKQNRGRQYACYYLLFITKQTRLNEAIRFIEEL